jgi:RimJ/RimL family protein N-acetyltransferase
VRQDSDPSAVIRTERLAIRPWRVEEADRFYDMHRRMEVARWIGGRPMQNRDEAVDLIERNLAGLAANPAFGSWAVVLRCTNVAAGSVLLKPLPEGDGEIEIGWHLHPDSWGHGFATEAAAAVLRRGFSNGLKEVWAVTHLANDRSAHVCRKIGMRLLGVTHRWYDDPSLMFWIGARADLQPTLEPDEPAPAQRAPE